MWMVTAAAIFEVDFKMKEKLVFRCKWAEVKRRKDELKLSEVKGREGKDFFFNVLAIFISAKFWCFYCYAYS